MTKGSCSLGSRGRPAMGGKRPSTRWQSTAPSGCTLDFARRDGQATLARVCATLPPAPATASPQLRRARELLTTLPRNKEDFIRHLKKMRAEDPVQGPLNLHWCFSALARALPHGTGRDFFLKMAETSLREGVTMRKLRQGWGQYGLEPWDVVNHKPEPQMARYNSAPTLRSHTPLL